MELTPNFSVTLYSFEDCIDLTYKLTQFNAGELHPQLQDYPLIGDLESITIRPITYGPTFMVELALLVNALRYEFHMSTPIDLDLPYVPYSRQDRVCADGDAFGLKVFADQLNALNLNRVVIFDSHSDVAPALINNCIHREAKNLFILNSRFLDKYSHLVSPDAGAYKKVNSIASLSNLPVIPALKTRDTSTGRLSNTVLVTDGVTNPSRFLIIDDICDGGYTFILLAKEIKKVYPDIPLDLYISHGFFSKGLEPLLSAGISHIYTTNSVCTLSYHNLTVLD